MFRLSDDDGRMIDLLLDSDGSEKPPSNGAAHPALPVPEAVESERSRKRLECLERLFDILRALPAEDPPGTLRKRTIESLQALAGTRLSPIAPACPDLATPVPPQL